MTNPTIASSPQQPESHAACAPVTYTAIGYEEVDSLRACGNCGHEIKRLYTVRSSSGHTMIVGSECVVLLCGANAVGRTELRAKRAATQWRANKPTRRPGETKATYVNRRIREMANAMTAYRALIEFERRDFDKAGFKLAKRAARWHKLPHTVDERHGYVTCRCQGEWICYRHLLRQQLLAHFAKRIGRKYGANPYDFNRPAWEVAKI